MTAADIRKAILDILHDIAPDEDLGNLKEDVPFREQFELDSMDFLDIVMELRKRYRKSMRPQARRSRRSCRDSQMRDSSRQRKPFRTC